MTARSLEIKVHGNPTEPSPGGTRWPVLPLALGEHGSISVMSQRGFWVARCRFRGLDGVIRRVARCGTSKAGAQAALQDEPRQRCCRCASYAYGNPFLSWSTDVAALHAGLLAP